MGVSDVACVGKGTVSAVLPESAVARAWAISVAPLMKFTTGSPNPRLANPVPVIVNVAGGVARSNEAGVIAPPRVSLTVNAALPISVKALVPVCCHTCA